MNPFSTFISYLFMLSTLCSCVTYKEVVLTKVVSVNVKQITTQKMVVDIEMMIDNPNPYTIRVLDFNLDVFINNLPSGKAIIPETLVLKKKSEDIHLLTVETNMASAATGLFSSLFTLIGSRSAKLGLKGDVRAKAYFIRKTIPLDLEHIVNF